MLVCNQAALDLLGLTEDQLLGKTSFDPEWNVIHEDGNPFPGDNHPVPMSIRTRKPEGCGDGGLPAPYSGPGMATGEC